MKKLLSFFLSIALLSTLSFTAYATEVAPSVPQEHAIPSIPEEISFENCKCKLDTCTVEIS